MFVDTYEPEFFKDGLKAQGAVVAPMETGDYVWVGREGVTWAIERKSANDLITSIIHGNRLADQMRRLISTFRVPILLIEGYVKPLPNGKLQVPKKEGGMHSLDFTYTALENIKLEAQMAGAMIVQTASEMGTLNQIRSLYAFSQKETHDWINSRTRSGELRLHRSQQAHLLMGMPSIGEKTANELLSIFGSPIAFFEALYKNPSMVKMVDGISESRVQAMRGVLLPNEND